MKAAELRVAAPPTTPALRIAPYPGGRHPRIGFLEGAIAPLRGTKASVFLPWDPASYVLVDLPEAIFSHLGLQFLAHTHVPTIWNAQNKVIDNIDWTRAANGALTSRWKLPNDVVFGASIRAEQNQVAMDLELTNGTPQKLEKLRTQVCVMLKGARGFRRPVEREQALRRLRRGRWRRDRPPLDPHRLAAHHSRLGQSQGAVFAHRSLVRRLRTRPDGAPAGPPMVP